MFYLLSIVGVSLSASASEQLLIEPDMGRTPILNAINRAHQINLVMYGFTDQAFTNALHDAHTAGKSIKVLLQQHPYKLPDENTATIHSLRRAHIPMHWPTKSFKLTHQKTFIFDQSKALVLTFNLTHSSFKNERNFGLFIDNPLAVADIESVFNADYQHQPIANHNSQLIWSPDARPALLKLLSQAKQKITMYAEGVSDYQMVGALAKAAKQGIKIQVLTSSYNNSEPSKKIQFLRQAGVDIRYSKGLIIHAKVIIIDNQIAVLGSTNLTKASLDNNRELSVITHNPAIIKQLDDTFAKDWRATSNTINTVNKTTTYTQFINHEIQLTIKHYTKKILHKISKQIASELRS